MASVVGPPRLSRCQPKVELNSLTDEILIKIFVYLDFKTRHNWIPLVCHRWARLVKSNELWHDVLVVPREESVFCHGTAISQSKVFHWCCQPHVRPFVQRLKLMGLGAEHDDFTSVGLGALFGICCAALTRLEIHATRTLLSDLSSLLCLMHIEELSLTCIDPDPLNPFHSADVQCVAKLSQLRTLVFDLNLVHVPGDLSQLQKLRSLSVGGTGSTPLSISFQLSSLCQLQYLAVKKPLWVEVPDVVHHLPRLKSFEIRGHTVFGHNLGFSPAAAKMSQLERLGIVAHMLQRTPEEVGNMVFLKHLDLSWNPFDERLPGEVVFPFKKLCRLETLDLSHCGLKHLPVSLSYLTSLTRLNLSGNLLDSMSNVLRHCFELKRLIMRGCGLESVPVEIADIENLEHLDISNNPITSVDGLSALLIKERFVSLVFRQEKWNPLLVTTACSMARLWGKRAPIVD